MTTQKKPWINRYEEMRNRHRQATNLDQHKAPESATHIAILPSGVQYYVMFKDGSCWIQPSDQYGSGYAFCSLYQKDVKFVELTTSTPGTN